MAYIKLQQPLRGYTDAPSYRQQSGDYTKRALNVVPYDVWEGRLRIGSRQGFCVVADFKSPPTSEGADQPIQGMMPYKVYRASTLIERVLVVQDGKVYDCTPEGPQPSRITFQGSGGNTTDLSAAAKRVAIIQFQNFAYLADGANYFKIDLSQSSLSVVPWTPADVIANGTLMCVWGARVVISGFTATPNLWVASAVADPETFTATAGVSSAAAGIGGGNSPEYSKLGDHIKCVVPFGSGGLLLGCRDSISYLDRDPVFTGATLQQLSREVGVVGPNAICEGPEKSAFLVGNDGVYIARPNDFNIDRGDRISAGSLDGFFQRTDRDEIDNTLIVYNESRSSLQVFLSRPSAQETSNHLEYHLNTNSWWPFKISDPRNPNPRFAAQFKYKSDVRETIWLAGPTGRISTQPNQGVFSSDGKRVTSSSAYSTDSIPPRSFDTKLMIGPVNDDLSQRLLLKDIRIQLQSNDQASSQDDQDTINVPNLSQVEWYAINTEDVSGNEPIYPREHLVISDGVKGHVTGLGIEKIASTKANNVSSHPWFGQRLNGYSQPSDSNIAPIKDFDDDGIVNAIRSKMNGFDMPTSLEGKYFTIDFESGFPAESDEDGVSNVPSLLQWGWLYFDDQTPGSTFSANPEKRQEFLTLSDQIVRLSQRLRDEFGCIVGWYDVPCIPNRIRVQSGEVELLDGRAVSYIRTDKTEFSECSDLIKNEIIRRFKVNLQRILGPGGVDFVAIPAHQSAHIDDPALFGEEARKTVRIKAQAIAHNEASLPPLFPIWYTTIAQKNSVVGAPYQFHEQLIPLEQVKETLVKPFKESPLGGVIVIPLLFKIMSRTFRKTTQSWDGSTNPLSLNIRDYLEGNFNAVTNFYGDVNNPLGTGIPYWERFWENLNSVLGGKLAAELTDVAHMDSPESFFDNQYNSTAAIRDSWLTSLFDYTRDTHIIPLFEAVGASLTTSLLANPEIPRTTASLTGSLVNGVSRNQGSTSTTGSDIGVTNKTNIATLEVFDIDAVSSADLAGTAFTVFDSGTSFKEADGGTSASVFDGSTIGDEQGTAGNIFPGTTSKTITSGGSGPVTGRIISGYAAPPDGTYIANLNSGDTFFFGPNRWVMRYNNATDAFECYDIADGYAMFQNTGSQTVPEKMFDADLEAVADLNSANVSFITTSGDSSGAAEGPLATFNLSAGRNNSFRVRIRKPDLYFQISGNDESWALEDMSIDVVAGGPFRKVNP